MGALDEVKQNRAIVFVGPVIGPSGDVVKRILSLTYSSRSMGGSVSLK